MCAISDTVICCISFHSWLVGGHLGTWNVNGKLMSPPIASLNMEWTSPNTSSWSQLDSKCILPIRPLLVRTECFLQGTTICSPYRVTGKNIIVLSHVVIFMDFMGFKPLEVLPLTLLCLPRIHGNGTLDKRKSNNACNHLVVDSIGTHHLKHTRPKALHTSIKTYT